MKRFKKLTIYILVGVLLSSSVMLSYRKADEVKASATLTLGTGALIMLGIFGAYGIVYKGNIDSALDEYVWKGDRGLYPHEVQEAEEWWAQMWDNTVRQYASNNGYDPDNWNDDDNDLETQPPLWEKVIGTVEKNKRPLKLLASAFGYIASKLAFGVYQESQNSTSNEKSGIVLNNGDSLRYGFNSKQDGVNYLAQYRLESLCDDMRIIQGYRSSDDSIINFYVSTSPLTFKRAYKTIKSSSRNDWSQLDGDKELTQFTTIYSNNSAISSVNVNGVKYYYLYNNCASASNISNNSLPLSFDLSNISIQELIADIYSPNYSWGSYNELLNQENIGLGSDIAIDNSNNELQPISPTITIPTASMLDKLLNDLESSYGNESGTQQAVDDFIADLEYTEPSPEPEPDPEPNPNPNPEGGGGTTTDPDVGGEGGSGSADDKDNSSLLADLKNVFPFCIPFDLVNCIKLFNAEPEAPRVEIPLHFKLNNNEHKPVLSEEYVFVIDLKEFDGVAEVCRAMFLILFIVGLVLSTRSLIRG